MTVCGGLHQHRSVAIRRAEQGALGDGAMPRPVRSRARLAAGSGDAAAPRPSRRPGSRDRRHPGSLGARRDGREKRVSRRAPERRDPLDPRLGQDPLRRGGQARQGERGVQRRHRAQARRARDRATLAAPVDHSRRGTATDRRGPAQLHDAASGGRRPQHDRACSNRVGDRRRKPASSSAISRAPWRRRRRSCAPSPICCTRRSSRRTVCRSALRRYVDGFGRRTKLETRLRISAKAEKLPFSVQRALLRVVQEALANVHRHASASKVSVAVKCVADRVHLVVADDGKGANGTAEARAVRVLPGRRRHSRHDGPPAPRRRRPGDTLGTARHPAARRHARPWQDAAGGQAGARQTRDQALGHVQFRAGRVSSAPAAAQPGARAGGWRLAGSGGLVVEGDLGDAALRQRAAGRGVA